MDALYAYINTTLDFAGDVADMCKDYTIVDLNDAQPADTTEAVGSTAYRIWIKKVDIYVERLTALDNNLRTIFTVIWGQCSNMMQTKLKALPEYDAKAKEKDCVWLLKEIKGIMNHFDGSKYIYVSLDDATEEYYRYRQGHSQPLDSYYKTFKAHVEVLEHYGANVGGDTAFLKDVESSMTTSRPTNLTSPTYLTDMNVFTSTRAKLARNKATAISFLKRSDHNKYGSLWTDLQNQYSRGNDQYPKNLTAAYELLLTHVANNENRNPNRRYDPKPDPKRAIAGIQFLQSAERIPGIDGIVHDGITCYGCRQMGHYASACPTVNPADSNSKPNADTRAIQMLQVTSVTKPPASRSEVTFLQSNDRFNMIPSSWILLDSQSTVSVFNNSSLLHDIKHSADNLLVYTNGGTQTSSLQGTSDIFGKVWYNPESLANIVSMALLRRSCRITMDTSIENAICVHRRDGSVMKFREYESGLYYFDMADSNSINSSVTAYQPFTFIQSVADNKAFFSQREIDQANRARALYRKIGRPSESEFQPLLQLNLIHNCPVTPDDAKRALVIYGPDVATLKGKTAKKATTSVPRYNRVDLPPTILTHHSKVALCVDFMFVNNNVFFTSISKDLQFRTVAPVNSRSKATMLREIRAVMDIYRRRGFTIESMYGDQEFECIENDLNTDVFIADTDDHVPEIERSIRTIKDRVRSTVHGMPYKYLPRIMVRGLVEHAVKCLNQFPALNGISPTISPLTLVTGITPPTFDKLSLEFGSYAQIFELNTPTNTNKARTTGAIALNTSNGAQGGYQFMSLTTGDRLSRQQWTELPMPNWVIDKVESLAKAEKQKEMNNNEPLWEWRPGVPMVFDDDDVDHSIIFEPLADLEPTFDDMPLLVRPSDDSDSDSDDDDSDDDATLSDDESVADAIPDIESPVEPVLVSDADLSEDSSTHPDIDDNPVCATVDNDDLSFDASGDSILSLGVPDGDHRSASSIFDDDHSATFERDASQRSDVFTDTSTFDPPPSVPPINPYPILDGAAQRSDFEQDSEPAPSLLRRSSRTPARQPSKVRFNLNMDAAIDKSANTKSYSDNIQLLQHGVHELQTLNRPDSVQRYITGFVMNQMTAKAGIKKHGQKAIDALYKEFCQLDDKSVFEGIDASTLTYEQRKSALRAVNLIKEKRTGQIKGRTCANGRPQRKLFTKEQTASPTVSTDALMLSILIDVKEGRDVAVADVEGAYLHADMDVFTVMKLVGVDVDIMCRVDKKYEKFVITENGKKV